jgi:hypothetical protein
MNKTDSTILTAAMAAAGGLTWFLQVGEPRSWRIVKSVMSAALAAAVFLLLCAVGGCERPLTTREITVQSDVCRQHHLKPVLYREEIAPRIVAVQCDTGDSR